MAKKSRTTNTVFNTFAGFGAKGINIVTTFIMRSVFIYTLGIEYSGISGLFTDILTMLSFAELGISSAIAYSLYKPVAQGDYRKIAALMDFYKKAYRVVAGVVLGAGLCVIPFLKFLVPAEKIDPAIRPQIMSQLVLIYVLYLCNSAVSYLLIYKSTLLNAYQEGRVISNIQFVMSIVRVIIECIILFSFMWTKNCFIIYLVVGIGLTITQNIIISRLATKRHPEVNMYPEERLTKEEKNKLFTDVRALMLYKLCTAVNNSIDSGIISSLCGSVWVGYLSNYRAVSSKLLSLFKQFFASVLPSTGNLAAESDEDKQHRTFRTMLFLTFWVSCFCTTGLIVMLNPFVDIWLGGKYVKTFWIVFSLALVFYLCAIENPVSTFRLSNGIFKEGKYRPLAMLIINVISSVAFAILFRNYFGSRYGEEFGSAMGVVGVKLATALAHISTLIWFDPWLVYKHVFKRPVKEYFKIFGIYALVTTGSCVLTYALGALLPFESKWVLFIIKFIMCIIIPNGAIILIFRNTREFKDSAAIFKNLIKKVKKKKNKLAKAN